MYDTIIIGAGMSGLAAGIRLAYFDQRVCILERHYSIGGLNSFYRLGGRNFDVGLHAVTNYTPKGAKRGPLAKLLRQLRFAWEEFALAPQLGSAVVFPQAFLNFNNDLSFLESEIAREFPAERDNFQKLLSKIVDYENLESVIDSPTAREIVGATIKDPLLVEMLLCPAMFYGNARQNDMDFAQFCIMFRSIFMEGLARPLTGVRVILKKLVQKFKTLGGELRLKAGVSRIASSSSSASDAPARVVLENGTEIEGRRVLSSAGWYETMRMCDQAPAVDHRQAGQLSFTETMSVLDRQPRDLGHERTIVFYNDSDKFHWEKPNDLADVRSGVICSPNNFAYDDPPTDGLMRITSLANFDAWRNLPPEEYARQKESWYQRTVDAAVKFVPDFRKYVIATDMFTPTTIRRYTSHDNGAVYGAPHKRYDGTTHLKNLFICGTDQGLVGIIGAIISGIQIANRHLLRDPGTAT